MIFLMNAEDCFVFFVHAGDWLCFKAIKRIAYLNSSHRSIHWLNPPLYHETDSYIDGRNEICNF